MNRLYQLIDGTWIDPATIIRLSISVNGNEKMGGWLVSIRMTHDAYYNIWFQPSDTAQDQAEKYRDDLAKQVNKWSI